MRDRLPQTLNHDHRLTLHPLHQASRHRTSLRAHTSHTVCTVKACVGFCSLSILAACSPSQRLPHQPARTDEHRRNPSQRLTRRRRPSAINHASTSRPNDTAPSSSASATRLTAGHGTDPGESYPDYLQADLDARRLQLPRRQRRHQRQHHQGRPRPPRQHPRPASRSRRRRVRRQRRPPRPAHRRLPAPTSTPSSPRSKPAAPRSPSPASRSRPTTAPTTSSSSTRPTPCSPRNTTSPCCPSSSRASTAYAGMMQGDQHPRHRTRQPDRRRERSPPHHAAAP